MNASGLFTDITGKTLHTNKFVCLPKASYIIFGKWSLNLQYYFNNICLQFALFMPESKYTNSVYVCKASMAKCHFLGDNLVVI